MLKASLKRRIKDGQQGGAVTPYKGKKPLRLPLHLRDGKLQWFWKERKRKKWIRNKLRKNKATL